MMAVVERDQKMSLAALRVNVGLTQEELANRCGVSKTTVISWEAGRSLPNVKRLPALEAALGYPYSLIRFGK